MEVLLAMVAFSAQVSHAAACTDAALTGTYGLLVTGYDSSGLYQHGMAQIKSNGKGSFTGMETVMTTGRFFAFKVAITGTYAINANCTGSARSSMQRMGTRRTTTSSSTCRPTRRKWSAPTRDTARRRVWRPAWNGCLLTGHQRHCPGFRQAGDIPLRVNGASRSARLQRGWKAKPRSWPEPHRTRRVVGANRAIVHCAVHAGSGRVDNPSRSRVEVPAGRRSAAPGSQQSCSQICRCRRVVVGVVVVDQAGCGDRRHAGQGAAKLLECSIANCRIGREVTDFARVTMVRSPAAADEVVGSHTGAH